MLIILLGLPGTGKGTQAAAIKNHYQIPHISTGDILRENTRNHTPLGEKAKGYMEKGDLVPDDLILGMVSSRLKEPDCAPGALLDGFPRTLEQAKAFDQSLMDSGEKIDHVILLEMSLEGVVKRMAGRRVCRSCGNPFHVEFKPPPENMVCPNCQGEIYQRADDSPLAIQNRLEVFVRDTGPLIPFYAGKRILRRVDGSMSPHEVEAAIFKILG